MGRCCRGDEAPESDPGGPAKAMRSAGIFIFFEKPGILKTKRSFWYGLIAQGGQTDFASVHPLSSGDIPSQSFKRNFLVF